MVPADRARRRARFGSRSARPTSALAEHRRRRPRSVRGDLLHPVADEHGPEVVTGPGQAVEHRFELQCPRPRSGCPRTARGGGAGAAQFLQLLQVPPQRGGASLDGLGCRLRRRRSRSSRGYRVGSGANRAPPDQHHAGRDCCGEKPGERVSSQPASNAKFTASRGELRCRYAAGRTFGAGCRRRVPFSTPEGTLGATAGPCRRRWGPEPIGPAVPRPPVIHLLAASAVAATLPGVALPFDLDPAGRGSSRPICPPRSSRPAPGRAGRLVAVDDLVLADPLAVQRAVAAGPGARPAAPVRAPRPAEGGPTETIVVIRRAELSAPSKSTPSPTRPASPAPAPGSRTRSATRCSSTRAARRSRSTPRPAPSAAPRSRPGAAARGLGPVLDALQGLLGDRPERRGRHRQRPPGPRAARRAASGPRPGAPGRRPPPARRPERGRGLLRRLAARYPGAAGLHPERPETCLASGRQLLAELGDRRGPKPRPCASSASRAPRGPPRPATRPSPSTSPRSKPRVEACIGRRRRGLQRGRQRPVRARARRTGRPRCSASSTTPASSRARGRLGERLRRLEDVGAGCMRLAMAYDRRRAATRRCSTSTRPVCSAGPTPASEATERRHLAFAARTVRECEDPRAARSRRRVSSSAACSRPDRCQRDASTTFGAFLRACKLGAAERVPRARRLRRPVGHREPARVAEAEPELRRPARRRAAGLPRRGPPAGPPRSADAMRTARRSGCSPGPATRASARPASPAPSSGGSAHAKKVEAPDQAEMWHRGLRLHNADGCAGLGERIDLGGSSTGRRRSGPGPAPAMLGDAHSCSELGHARRATRTSRPGKGEQAPATYLARGCDNGDPEGCFWLARDHAAEVAASRRSRPTCSSIAPARASTARVRGARVGAPRPRDQLRRRDCGPPPRHRLRNGHYESCKILGDMYLRGKGVERDRQQANELLDRFRLNATRKYVRLGVQLGIRRRVVGGELELVVPIPVGPALSFRRTARTSRASAPSWCCWRATRKPPDPPDLQVLGASVRLYANHQARGMFAAVGVHQAHRARAARWPKSGSGSAGALGSASATTASCCSPARDRVRTVRGRRHAATSTRTRRGSSRSCCPTSGSRSGSRRSRRSGLHPEGSSDAPGAG